MDIKAKLHILNVLGHRPTEVEAEIKKVEEEEKRNATTR